MKRYIEKRAIELAKYIVNEEVTVRKTAKNFGISKSTVHKDITERLMEIDADLAIRVKALLDRNKAERHIRGGIATKAKYSLNTKNSTG